MVKRVGCEKVKGVNAEKCTKSITVRKCGSFGSCVVMILPQVHLRKPCYDFTFL